MKRIAQYTDVELSQLGGKVGPNQPRKRISAGRVLRAVRGVSVPRTNHLPARRELFAVQREPEK